jgi:hypothetical protein
VWLSRVKTNDRLIEYRAAIAPALDIAAAISAVRTF